MWLDIGVLTFFVTVLLPLVCHLSSCWISFGIGGFEYTCKLWKRGKSESFIPVVWELGRLERKGYINQEYYLLSDMLLP